MNLLDDKNIIASRIEKFIWDKSVDTFADVACALFDFQFHHIDQACNYYTALGITPDNLKTVTDIPPIGLNVFKETSFFAGTKQTRIFKTSGTSGKGQGLAYFDELDLELMETSIIANCQQHLFADNRKTRFLMLVPSPDEAPDIIMAYGMNRIAENWGLEQPLFAVRKSAFLGKEAVSYIRQAIADNVPLTIIGGSFGFVNFIDAIQENIKGLHLPQGSRLLDAGGFKGRSRELNRHDFLDLTRNFFGVPPELCFNLYGLTELSSQFYSQAGGSKKPPHWTRVRVCHPLTLNEVEVGDEGVAVLYDLASISKPFVILTDDLAIRHQEGFELLGRASGSAPRGCSLSLEEVR